MKSIYKLSMIAVLLLITACGSDGKKKSPDYSTKKKPVKKEVVKKNVKSETKKATKKEGITVDLSNKGVGPIKSITLPETIDKAMADKGKQVFKTKCTSCHRVTKKFIGPNPTGILKRRSPEWVMNMILNPEKMVKEDPIAKQLLVQFNGSPMANQNLTEDEARQVLEYFRTLK